MTGIPIEQKSIIDKGLKTAVQGVTNGRGGRMRENIIII